jgi:hypothetical protein
MIPELPAMNFIEKSLSREDHGLRKSIPKQRPNAGIVTTSGRFTLTYLDLQFRNCAASWHSRTSHCFCAKKTHEQEGVKHFTKAGLAAFP